jgi:hypothetical protein
MTNENKAQEIYDYAYLMFADGVYVRPKIKREILKEIGFILTTD